MLWYRQYKLISQRVDKCCNLSRVSNLDSSTFLQRNGVGASHTRVSPVSENTKNVEKVNVELNRRTARVGCGS